MANKTMTKKKTKMSVADRLIKVLTKQPKDAEEIRKELKDRFGFNEKPAAIRVNLLYLLRREKIKRKKDGKIYRYHI